MKATLLTSAIAGLVLGLAAADALTGPAGTGPAPEATTGPKIQFASPIHDFGKVDVGAVVKHTFVFTNTGTQVLEILNVRPGCGCTTAGTWDKRIEPGQTGSIPLQLNTAGFGGTIAKSATVTCNDPSQSNLVLQIRGTIWRPIDVNPQSAYFNLASDASASEVRVLRIVNNLENPITLANPECTHPGFQTELKILEPGREFELRVTVQPRMVTNYAQSTVTLKTSVTNPPFLSIPVYANVQPAVIVMPSVITLPAASSTGPRRSTVTIRSMSTNALALSDATINLDGAAVEVKESQPGRVFTLSVNIPADLQLQATQRVEISLKSNHPKFPVIKVPVQQQPRPPGVAARGPITARPAPTRTRPVPLSTPPPAPGPQ